MVSVIIAGSRTIYDPLTVAAAIAASQWEHEITEVVTGKQKSRYLSEWRHHGGVDFLAEEWAIEHGIPVKGFQADWNAFRHLARPDGSGNPAGPLRNAEMADYADRLIAVRDVGPSNGTDNMIDTMRQRGKPVFVYDLRYALTFVPPPPDDAAAAAQR